MARFLNTALANDGMALPMRLEEPEAVVEATISLNTTLH
jgi:hypothetical protein